MYSIVSTAIVRGIESVLVQVEADVSCGMPAFDMVGFLGAEVKEARERVRTALRNTGYILPAKRITINLSPAGVRKTGTGFDLPIAVAVMIALEIVEMERTKEMLIVGEIGLNGSVQGIPGILPIVLEAKRQGLKKCMIPKVNYKEATLVRDMEIIPVESLLDVIAYLKEGKCKKMTLPDMDHEINEKQLPDFAQMNGQVLLKRACEVAVSGMHNLLLIGPPGAGKTLAAKRIPSILPSMDETEQLDLSKIYSVCGMFEEKEKLLDERPFRSPHHTVTPQGLAGGGAIPRPGEISLAHHGVLFLDELTEFKKEALETLRQPLEDKSVRLVRTSGSYLYPADFILVAAMNPCPCGNYPNMQKCRCTQAEINHYLNRISQPLLDRIDLCVEVPKIPYNDLAKKKEEEDSLSIRQRVTAAHEIQRERFKNASIKYNSQMTMELIEEFCELGSKEKIYMEEVYTRLNLSARAYHKILKTARTLADLSEERQIGLSHLNEAVLYRSIDKKFWEKSL